MREIKFRAWDEENKKFVIDIDLSYDFIEDIPHLNLESRGFEVMQFTGLKDKNGKEIYEGDIVKSKDNMEVFKDEEGNWKPIIGMIVKWNEEYTGFEPFIDMLDSEYTGNSYSPEDVEVIGNIYENPELLEKK